MREALTRRRLFFVFAKSKQASFLVKGIILTVKQQIVLTCFAAC
jgi:hypothetical protein